MRKQENKQKDKPPVKKKCRQVEPGEVLQKGDWCFSDRSTWRDGFPTMEAGLVYDLSPKGRHKGLTYWRKKEVNA